MSIDLQTDIRNTCLYDGGHFAVLMAMADCANTKEGDGIFPGIDLLAANARLKQRRTQDIIQDLRADLVVILQGDDGDDLGPEVQPTGGRGRKTEYRIDLEKVQLLQGLHLEEVAAGLIKCHFCEAREKRLRRRLGKGAIPNTKGAENDRKGAISDVKGAISGSHIDRTKEPSIEPSGEPPPASPASGGPGQGDLLGDVLPPEEPPPTPSQILALAYDAFEAAAARVGWPAVQKRTATRDKHLKARLEDVGGLEGWRLALEKAEGLDFLCGRSPPRPGQPPFKAYFDFLTRESSFVNLMEGKYDNRESSGPGRGGGGSNAEIAARVAARRAAARAGRHPDS